MRRILVVALGLTCLAAIASAENWTGPVRSLSSFDPDSLELRLAAQHRSDQIYARSERIALRAIRSICRGCLDDAPRIAVARLTEPMATASATRSGTKPRPQAARRAFARRTGDGAIRRALLAGLLF